MNAMTKDYFDMDREKSLLAPYANPRQSRSCPCSPKLSRRTCSPAELNTDSPKSRSFVTSAKFSSLSSSLLAIHRQASSSLVIPEFLLKSYSNKSDTSPVASKTSSHHNSLKLETKKVRQTLSTSDTVAPNVGENNSSKEREDIVKNSENVTSTPTDNEPAMENSSSNHTKCPLNETQSLPTLRLSKMSLTYRSATGTVTSADGDESSATNTDATNSATNIIYEEEREKKQVLPDVVPCQEINYNNSSNDLHITKPKSAVGNEKAYVNLGFDGSEESSDFMDIKNYDNSQVVYSNVNNKREDADVATEELSYIGQQRAGFSGKLKSQISIIK